jgi:hypothetical protein
LRRSRNGVRCNGDGGDHFDAGSLVQHKTLWFAVRAQTVWATRKIFRPLFSFYPSCHRFIIALQPYWNLDLQQLRQQKSFVSHPVLDLFIAHFYSLVIARGFPHFAVPETALESE